ncbi:MAG: RHS repeat-associated core domain-containing protein, partial [Clostridia bacterium]|nr:RHS repeat-associated core domain-containing protein [Clostridia bacterium]
MIRSLVYTVEGILTVEYEYNYLGDRISKTVAGEKTTYTLEYSSGLSQVIEETTNSKTVFYVRGLDLISREELGKTYFYVLDGGNTVRDLVDEDGNVTDKYIFDSFGNEISHEGDSNNSYGVQGEQFDEETGLYYLRARYMNSSTGTFTSMDTYGGSLSDPTSLHKYLFANSNPVKYCDPTGYCSILEMDAAEVISLMLDNAMYSMFFYCLDTAATDPACERHSIVGCLIAGIIGGVLGTFIMALSTPFRAVAAVIFGGAGIKKGIDDIADGNVLYGILEVIVGAYFVLTGLG